MTLRQRLTTGLIVGCLAAASLGGCSGGDAADDGNDDNSIHHNAQQDAGDSTDTADNGNSGDASDAAGDHNSDNANDADTGGDPPDSGDDSDNDENANDENDQLPDEPGEFGDICGEERPCVSDHFCHYTDGSEFGVCTRSCAPEGSSCTGIPAPGTNAECTQEDDDGFACGFICVLDHDDHIHQYDCPDELTCEGTGGPGQGHRYCLP